MHPGAHPNGIAWVDRGSLIDGRVGEVRLLIRGHVDVQDVLEPDGSWSETGFTNYTVCIP